MGSLSRVMRVLIAWLSRTQEIQLQSQQPLYAWIDNMKIITVFPFLLFSNVLFAADSVGVVSPPITNSGAVKGAACSRLYEETVSSSGMPLVCYGGLWRDVGMNGYEKLSYNYFRTPSDNYKTLVHTKACPAGKRLIHTDCNFNGGTNQHGKSFIGAADDNTAICFFRLLNAYDPAYPGGHENSLVTTAYCLNYE